MKFAIAFLVLLGQAQTTKPPKLEYDKVKDESFANTGVVPFRRGSSFSYAAGYVYRGTTPVRPKTIILNFYARRINEANKAANDGDYAKWADVKEITLRWAKEPMTYKAEYFKYVDTDSTSQILVGRSFVERLRTEIPVADFVDLATAKSLLFALGQHTDELKEKELKPITTLVASMPPEAGA